MESGSKTRSTPNHWAYCSLAIDSDSDGCSARPLLGHHALVRVVGFRMAGFMLSGSGIRACVLGNVELGWGGWGKVQFNVAG